MAKAIPTNMLDACPVFPDIRHPIIERPQLLYMLDTLFEVPADFVVLCGEDGAGKTVLSWQFAKSRPDRAFCIYTNGLSAATRSVEYLLWQVADQVHWHLHGTRLPEKTSPSIFVQESVLRLHKLASRQKRQYYFVVDGLLQLAEDAPDVVDVILREYLPTGMPTFRFLLTGTPGALPARLSEKVRVQSFPIPGFSPDEARQFLSDLVSDDRILLDINRAFRGVPGKLASVRRLIGSGSMPTLLADSIATSLTDLFTLEWKVVNDTDHSLVLSLAALAHAKHPLTMRDLAMVVQAPEEQLAETLTRLPFVDKSVSGEVQFISASFKQFAARRLSGLHTDVINTIFDRLFGNITPEAGDVRVPEYLEAANRPDDVVRYITPDYLTSVCTHSESLTPVRGALAQGARAAKEIKDYPQLLKFSLESVIVTSLNTVAGLRSEVLARLRLGDRATALTLARSATLKEDRLELLSLIGRHDSTDSTRRVDLTPEIERLTDASAFSSDPERALRIARDMLFFARGCALRLVDAATRADYQSQGFDVTLAELSLLAASDVKRERSIDAFTADDISSKISNPAVRRLTRASCAVVNSLDADDLVTDCDKIQQAGDALFLLSRWTATQPEDPSAWKVIRYALDRMLKDSDYTPEARVMRTLATPLPALASSAPYECNQLLRRISVQQELLQKRGPTVEYARLVSLLARSEGVWDSTGAVQRLEELYVFLTDLDVSTQTEALAWVVHELKADMPGHLDSALVSFRSAVEQQLITTLNRLIGGTADQYQALKGTVRALTERRPDLVRHIIPKVNVQERRDALRNEAVMVLISPDLKQKSPEAILELLSGFESVFAFERTLAETLAELAEFSSSPMEVKSWEPFLRRALGVKGAVYGFQSCVDAYRLWCRLADGKDAKLGAELVDRIGSAYQAINSEWDRAEGGFDAAADLAELDPKLASDYLKSAYEERRRSPFTTVETVNPYVLCVRLVVRAFAGLARRKGDIEDPLRRISGIIDRLPSDAVRATMWTEAALWCFAYDAPSVGERIVDQWIRPLLRNIMDPTHREFIVAEAAAALFYAHPQTAIDDLAALKPPFKDMGFANICWFILKRIPSGEPFDSTLGHCYAVRYQDLVDITECVKQIEADNIFYSVLSAVSRSSTSESGLKSITRDSRLEIARRFEEIARQKLPDKVRIQHEGYIIASEAQLCRMRQAGVSCWEALGNRARSIANDADRCYVFGIVAEAIPSRFSTLRDEMFSEARKYIKTIPSLSDRLGRLSNLAETCAEFDASCAKELLREAMDLSRGVDASDARSLQLQMVDLAYRIEPEFASSLVSVSDDDPARAGARKRLRRRLELNEARRNLLKGEEVQLTSEGTPVQNLSEFAWVMLGGLHSGRSDSFHWEKGIRYVECIQDQHIENAYPVLAWLIQNSVERHRQDHFGGDHIWRVFEAMTFGCDLAAQLVNRASGIHANLERLDGGSVSTDSDSVIIRAGQREKALQFIERWLQSTKPAHLKICDPYFALPDLEFLKLIRRVVPQCRVDILTSEKKQRELGLKEPFERAYNEYWRLRVSDQDPPDTDVTIAGILPTRKLGIHDRWWISAESGLAFGGSLNSLGTGDTTRISVLSMGESRDLEATEVDPYLTWTRREVDGEKIKYQKFSMP